VELFVLEGVDIIVEDIALQPVPVGVQVVAKPRAVGANQLVF